MACSGPTTRTFAFLWPNWIRARGTVLREVSRPAFGPAPPACATEEANCTPVLRQTLDTLERPISRAPQADCPPKSVSDGGRDRRARSAESTGNRGTRGVGAGEAGTANAQPQVDRKSVVPGKTVDVLGCR